jgi:hypothetical protein
MGLFFFSFLLLFLLFLFLSLSLSPPHTHTHTHTQTQCLVLSHTLLCSRQCMWWPHVRVCVRPRSSNVFFRCRKNFLPILNLKLLHQQTTVIKRLAGYDDWDLKVLFVSNSYIQDLNRRYRKQDKPTDILSFPTYPVWPR